MPSYHSLMFLSISFFDMLNKIISKYERGKSKKIKLMAVCIKAITGVLGASMILTQQHPYIILTILCIGAVTNEIINFIQEEENDQPNPPQS